MQLLQLTNTTAQHFIQSFSWMLIHSLWQGLLLAVVTGLILMFAKRAPASVRYNVVLVQLFLFILACGATFVWEWDKASLQTIAHPIAGVVKATSFPFNLTAENIRSFAKTCIAYFSANAPMIVLLWFILFIFRSLRMMGSMVYIHRAKNRFIYQPPAEWKIKIDVLCQKLQLRQAVTLLESGYVKMPMVIGHIKPVILVPVGLIAGLPAGQVEAILLHELAHIRRHDYMVNFLQTVTETMFFFNPGLLWISSLLREERENCCDDIALEQTKDKRAFVQALISFKEYSLYGSKYQVAFPGKKNHLLNRVTRILNNQNKAFGPAEKTFFMGGVIALSVVVAAAAIAQGNGSHYAISHKVHNAASIRHALKENTALQSAREITYTRIRRQDDIKKQAEIHEVANPAHINASTIPAQPIVPVALNENPEKAKLLADQLSAKQQQEDALRDQLQAKKDQDQALIDQQQAKRDQEQARLDQIQAKKDREQAKRDQGEVQKEQARQNEVQARKNAEQAKRNEEQNIRNSEQAYQNDVQNRKNAEQARRNEEQAKLNEIQVQKNREQATKNQTSVQE